MLTLWKLSPLVFVCGGVNTGDRTKSCWPPKTLQKRERGHRGVNEVWDEEILRAEVQPLGRSGTYTSLSVASVVTLHDPKVLFRPAAALHTHHTHTHTTHTHTRTCILTGHL